MKVRFLVMRRLALRASLLCAFLSFQLVGCSEKEPENDDAAQVEEAIQRLQSGLVIEEIENAQEGLSAADLEENSEVEKSETLDPSETAENAQVALETIAETPTEESTQELEQEVNLCPGIRWQDQHAQSSDSEVKQILTESVYALAECLRDAAREFEMANYIFRGFIRLHASSDGMLLSTLVEGDQWEAAFEALSRLQVERRPYSLLEGVQASLLRSDFANDDLDELSKLAKLRREIAEQASDQILAIIEQNESLFQVLRALPRYGALWILKESRDDPTGVKAAKGLFAGTGQEYPGFYGQFNALHLLYPYGVLAYTPSPGTELFPVDPFAGVVLANQMGSLLGSNQQGVDYHLNLYRHIKAKDNPELPEHKQASPGAARVAVIDTGVEFDRFSELGLFMGLGRPGEISSHDFSDGGSNPWNFAAGELAHGTGTSASILTTLANFAPEVLRQRKVELAMWKVSSVRNVLAGGSFSGSYWESRFFPLMDALFSQTMSAEAGEVAPDIVSASMVFNSRAVMGHLGAPDLLKRSKWLWVMAAGNSGIKTTQSRYTPCFGDYPESDRPRERILCIGALARVSSGASDSDFETQIAHYSNWGERVDVYAFENYKDVPELKEYGKLCPNGTSCATPVVAAAAAAAKTVNPELSSSEIRNLILLVSETKTLKVQKRRSSDPDEEREVKIFRPETMMETLLQLARNYNRADVNHIPF